MKTAPWFLIALLSFSGTAKAEDASALHGAVAVFDGAAAGCFVGGVVGSGNGMKGCAIGAGIGAVLTGAMYASSVSAAEAPVAPAQDQLNQDDGVEQ